MSIPNAAEFIRLRTSTDPDEYRRAAHEPATDEVWLDVISGYPEMRQWVAQNKTVTGTILELLSRDPDPAVRFVVAMRHQATPDILQRLAEDPEETVRARVALNKRTPEIVLERLLNDPSEMVRDEARRRLGPG
jgi:hypothetical protein